MLLKIVNKKLSRPILNINPQKSIQCIFDYFYLQNVVQARQIKPLFQQTASIIEVRMQNLPFFMHI